MLPGVQLWSILSEVAMSVVIVGHVFNDIHMVTSVHRDAAAVNKG